jgi:NADPH2:quinone reductase
VGGELAQQALRSLAWHGRYLVVGFAAGDIPAFPANLALLKEASIVGVFWGEWSRRNPRDSAQNMRELAHWVEKGKLQPRVSAAYPLQNFAEAFAEISGRKAMGKIVLTMA